MKMHGLGNDFVVVDQRNAPYPLDAGLVRRIADRHRGVGFDQLAEIWPDAKADARLVFWNADGSQSGACGNATRCIARYLMDERGADRLRLLTERGILVAEDAGGGLTRVNMGAPILDWQDIPLARPVDTLRLPIEGEPVATGMGNPHCTFFVEAVEDLPVERLGPQFEAHPLFPERTNVEFVEVVAPDRLRLRIWERGTGVTLASGSCASAAAVAAVRRGLVGRRVAVVVDGGELEIEWRDDGVWLTGPTAHVFDGVFTDDFLKAEAP
ncbi:MAG: diaminopimelate epimerase [Alphaproteobacteria bacterium]|nr:MAG: diaminopimelate epimerase [Alphaproteobacteria bacterium]